MRTFIALELPDGFAADVAALARQLSAEVEGRFMRRESYHLTLAFLGDVDEAELASAIAAIEDTCPSCSPVPLRADGLGKFGRSSDATLWLGIAPNPELDDLVYPLRDALVDRGVDFDEKTFKAHITLARRAKLPSGSLPPLEFPRDDSATCITVFKSTLEKDGAVYKPLFRYNLEAHRALPL